MSVDVIKVAAKVAFVCLDVGGQQGEGNVRRAETSANFILVLHTFFTCPPAKA